MPGIKVSVLVDLFVTALERAGATVLTTSPTNSRPVELRVITSDDKVSCQVFLWTITPGGGGVGVRPPTERRIQITNSPPFPLSPGVRTIVGGYSEAGGVWGFWDARRHGTFSPRSPSLQISANIIEEAGATGIAAQVRSTNQGREVSVAVRPDYLLWYVITGESLHNSDTDAPEVAGLIDATPEEEQAFLAGSQTPDEVARRVELVQTIRVFRDARFRPAVLQAYSYRCAICQTALKLVDAAHIVPVAHPRGTDEVTNGLAFCRLHHAAYDNGLIGVRSDYRVVLNLNSVNRLIELRLDSGIEAFRTALPESISTPASIEVRPSRAKLRLGMEIRQFPATLVG